MQKPEKEPIVKLSLDELKEPILQLSVNELKEAQSFISELLKKLETHQQIKEVPVAVFPPTGNVALEESRADKRFNTNIAGICSVIKRDAPTYLSEIPVCITDISQHGLRFTIAQPLVPYNILVLKFSLSPIKASAGQFYKNLQKKIYAEVTRVSEIQSPAGTQYEIGAISIESEKVEESLKEEEYRRRIDKLLATKETIRILIVSIREAQSKRLETALFKQRYLVSRTNQKRQAMALLRKNAYNIVISDIETVKINDYELIKDIRGEFPNLELLVEVDTIGDWKTLSAFKVADYLTKNFDDRELKTVLELLCRKLIYRNMSGNHHNARWKNNQNVLIINRNEAVRSLFCKASEGMKMRLYFSNDVKHAGAVLKRHKIRLLFLDVETVGPEGHPFLMNTKNEFPGIGVAVTAKDFQERSSYLASGADTFLVEPLGLQEILAV